MPNHVHLLIAIVGSRLAVTETAQGNQFSLPRKQSLPSIVGGYKSAVSREIHRLHKTSRDMASHVPTELERIWQSRYYEHIVRNQASYQTIWHYIDTNVCRWQDDSLYIPQN